MQHGIEHRHSVLLMLRVQLGDVKQQLQQEGNMLELQYAWFPVESGPAADLPPRPSGKEDHSKQSTSSLAAASYGAANCADAFSASASQSQPKENVAGTRRGTAASRTPFGSPLQAASRHQSGAASSSSSAHVLEEAVNSAQRSDLLQPQEHAGLEQRPSDTDAGLPAAPALDVVSSVSGLVTPCKAQHSVLQKPSEFCHRPSHSHPSTLQSPHATGWQGSSMPGAVQNSSLTPHSHRVTDSMECTYSQTTPSVPPTRLAELPSAAHLAGPSLTGNNDQNAEQVNHHSDLCLLAHSVQQPTQLSQALPSQTLSSAAAQHVQCTQAEASEHIFAEPSGNCDDVCNAASHCSSIPCSLPDQTQPACDVQHSQQDLFVDVAHHALHTAHSEHAGPPEHAGHAGPPEHTAHAEPAGPAEHAGPADSNDDYFGLPDTLDFDLPLLDFPEDDPMEGQMQQQGAFEAIHMQAERATAQLQDGNAMHPGQKQAAADELPMPQQSMSALLMSEVRRSAHSQIV